MGMALPPIDGHQCTSCTARDSGSGRRTFDGNIVCLQCCSFFLSLVFPQYHLNHVSLLGIDEQKEQDKAESDKESKSIDDSSTNSVDRMSLPSRSPSNHNSTDVPESSLVYVADQNVRSSVATTSVPQSRGSIPQRDPFQGYYDSFPSLRFLSRSSHHSLLPLSSLDMWKHCRDADMTFVFSDMILLCVSFNRCLFLLGRYQIWSASIRKYQALDTSSTHGAPDDISHWLKRFSLPHLIPFLLLISFPLSSSLLL